MMLLWLVGDSSVYSGNILDEHVTNLGGMAASHSALSLCGVSVVQHNPYKTKHLQSTWKYDKNGDDFHLMQRLGLSYVCK